MLNDYIHNVYQNDKIYVFQFLTTRLVCKYIHVLHSPYKQIYTSYHRCTSIGVGRLATSDGSTITTHNNDCQECDFRLVFCNFFHVLSLFTIAFSHYIIIFSPPPFNCFLPLCLLTPPPPPPPYFIVFFFVAEKNYPHTCEGLAGGQQETRVRHPRRLPPLPAH